MFELSLVGVGVDGVVAGAVSGGARQLGQQHPLRLRCSLRQAQGQDGDPPPPSGREMMRYETGRGDSKKIVRNVGSPLSGWSSCYQAESRHDLVLMGYFVLQLTPL